MSFHTMANTDYDSHFEALNWESFPTQAQQAKKPCLCLESRCLTQQYLVRQDIQKPSTSQQVGYHLEFDLRGTPYQCDGEIAKCSLGLCWGILREGEYLCSNLTQGAVILMVLLLPICPWQCFASCMFTLFLWCGHTRATSTPDFIRTLRESRSLKGTVIYHSWPGLHYEWMNRVHIIWSPGWCFSLFSLFLPIDFL